MSYRSLKAVSTTLCAMLLFAASAHAEWHKISLHDALKKGFVSLDARGLGGHTGGCINICLKNNVKRDLDIYIAPATAFEANSKGLQPLYAVGDEHLYVKAHQQQDASLKAFCGNYSAKSPLLGSRFHYWKQGDARMANVMKYIKSTAQYNYLGQQAVWALTNNRPVNTVFDQQRMVQSRALANLVAKLNGCPEPQYFTPSVKNTEENGPMLISDHSKAYVDFSWDSKSARNMWVHIYRADGTLYQSLRDGEKISTTGHSMTVTFDARTMPEGVYFICLKDDDNYLWAQRRVRIGDPCAGKENCDPCES